MATETAGAMRACGNRATVPDKKNPRGDSRDVGLVSVPGYPAPFQAVVSIGYCIRNLLRFVGGGDLRPTPHDKPSGNVWPCGVRISRRNIAEPQPRDCAPFYGANRPVGGFGIYSCGNHTLPQCGALPYFVA